MIKAENMNEKQMYDFVLNKSKTYTKELYKKENLSDELYSDNMKDIDIWANKYEKINGFKGLYQEHFNWINSILEMKVIKLGRLQFELLNKTDKIFDLVPEKHKENSILVNVHIREDGKLIPSACKTSYKRAWDYYKSKRLSFSEITFTCYSWLLNPDLKLLLPENSNIIQFQKKYKFLSFKENEEKPQIIERVFGLGNEKLENCSQNTILQKNLKKFWEKGYKFPMVKGYFIYKI